MADPDTLAWRAIERHDPAELLRLAKRQRGSSSKDLIFVGMHNLAQTRWCQMYAVLKSRENEEEFFNSYLFDRVRLALRLGLARRPPPSPESLLAFGDGLQLAEAERELQLSSAEVEEGSQERGRYGRRLRTVRWWFESGRYVVVGVPDGLTRGYVYEFKETKNSFMARFALPVARAQANLYAWFFGRPKIVVDLFVREERRLETLTEPANGTLAQEVLETFARVDAGGEVVAPKPFKCSACEFRHLCPIVGRA